MGEVEAIGESLPSPRRDQPLGYLVSEVVTERLLAAEHARLAVGQSLQRGRNLSTLVHAGRLRIASSIDRLRRILWTRARLRLWTSRS